MKLKFSVCLVGLLAISIISALSCINQKTQIMPKPTNDPYVFLPSTKKINLGAKLTTDLLNSSANSLNVHLINAKLSFLVSEYNSKLNIYQSLKKNQFQFLFNNWSISQKNKFERSYQINLVNWIYAFEKWSILSTTIYEDAPQIQKLTYTQKKNILSLVGGINLQIALSASLNKNFNISIIQGFYTSCYEMLILNGQTSSQNEALKVMVDTNWIDELSNSNVIVYQSANDKLNKSSVSTKYDFKDAKDSNIFNNNHMFYMSCKVHNEGNLKFDGIGFNGFWFS